MGIESNQMHKAAKILEPEIASFKTDSPHCIVSCFAIAQPATAV